MSRHQTIEVNGRTHVVREAKWRRTKITEEKMPVANYRDLGVALCGVLEQGESLNEWKQKHDK